MTTQVPPVMGGIPAGGLTGQVLVKTSGSDRDVAWGAASGGTSGNIDGGTATSSETPSAAIDGGTATSTP